MKYLVFLSIIVFLGAQGVPNDPNAPYEAWIWYCTTKTKAEGTRCKCEYLGTWNTLKNCVRSVDKRRKRFFKEFKDYYGWSFVYRNLSDYCFGKKERSWPKPHPTYYSCMVSSVS